MYFNGIFLRGRKVHRKKNSFQKTSTQIDVSFMLHFCVIFNLTNNET